MWCTDALEHGLTWEHAANAYNENQREKKQNMRLAVAISGSDAGARSDAGAAAGADSAPKLSKRNGHSGYFRR
jgi:hypothetical protein